jgi:hypothetical protein
MGRYPFLLVVFDPRRLSQQLGAPQGEPAPKGFLDQAARRAMTIVDAEWQKLKASVNFAVYEPGRADAVRAV